MAKTVTVSSKYRIVIPPAARAALSLTAGDELLILCKTDRLVIIPKPKSFAIRTAGLHRDIWQSADA
jgi:AbrB family looped-hinge helix DNA binding protein